MRIEKAEDAVESIPVVARLNESAAIGLPTLADHVAQRQLSFANEATGDRSAAVHELSPQFYEHRAGVVSNTVYAPADAIARLEHDCSNTAQAQVAGGGQASRTGTDDDDVSRGWRDRAHVASLAL
jgi:hypothetical protein